MRFVVQPGSQEPLRKQAAQNDAHEKLEVEKPVDDDRLLLAIKHAVEQSVRTRRDRAELSEIWGRVARLTQRELQVFRLVVRGKLNKQVAGELGMSEKTVKVHRARVMQKMQADSLAELVLLAKRAGEVRSES